MKKKKILGIAGFIGSGKSTAAKYFEKLGAEYIDADDVVDELYEPEAEGWRKVVNYFGREFLKKDGHINRGKLARFVFADRNKLKILNFLIHPMVTNEIMKKIDKSSANTIVIEATYFEKNHLLKFADKVLWIDAKKDVLKKRALRYPAMTEKLFEQILKCQVKPERIDFTVENNGTKARFYDELKIIWQKLH